MVIKVVALIIGILLAVAGIVYLTKEKDAEARKIYTITAVIGVVITVVSAVLLFR